MSKRRQPGEIVRRLPGSCFCGSPTPELVRLTDSSDGELHDCSQPCMVCEDPECREWANVQVVDTGRWMFHLSECEMEDREVSP